MDLFSGLIQKNVKTTNANQIYENARIVRTHNDFNQEIIIFKIKIILPILDCIMPL
jgi:hypothetical protein